MKRQRNAAIRRIGAALAATACLMTTQAAHAADPQTCSDVKMAAPGWTDIDATNAMAGVVLKALGYRQDVANLSVPITYQGQERAGRRVPRQLDARAGAAREAVRRRNRSTCCTRT